MLPLLGMRLSAGHPHEATLYLLVCIVGAQLVMVVVALLAGRFAPRWGRKRMLLIGFAALPIRGVLYTLTSTPTCSSRSRFSTVWAPAFGASSG